MTDLDLVRIMTAHPLFGLGLTLGVYLAAVRLHAALGHPSLLHPVLTSVAVIGSVIIMLGIDYAEYFAQTSPLHNALSIFVVLLAVPLVRRIALIRAARLAILIALPAGSAVAVATALFLPMSLGADVVLASSLAPKSATAAVAVGISERLGGIAGITAMTAVLTGLFGAVAGPALLASAGVKDERAAGFALGLASHAIGTARAFQISEAAGAFASLGMVLNALLTVALVPLALAIVSYW